MDRKNYSDYERYIILADKSSGRLRGTYVGFLNFQKVMEIVRNMANTDKSSYLYKGNIYSRRVKSSDAQRIVSNVAECRWNSTTFQMKAIATQLSVMI